MAGQFGIDVLGFAILSNHFHLVLRNRSDVAAAGVVVHRGDDIPERVKLPVNPQVGVRVDHVPDAAQVVGR